MVNVLTILNNLKTKVNSLDISKLRTVPVDWKKSSNAGDKQVKKTNFNTVKTKVNKLDKKFLMWLLLFSSINIMQINKISREKLEMLIKKPDINGLVTTTVLNERIREVKTTILFFRDSDKKTDYGPKNQKSRESMLLLLIIINLGMTYFMRRWNKRNYHTLSKKCLGAYNFF